MFRKVCLDRSLQFKGCSRFHQFSCAVNYDQSILWPCQQNFGRTDAKYSYLSDGTKLGSERADGSGSVYRGSLIYAKAPDGTLSLDCALVPGGRMYDFAVGRWLSPDPLAEKYYWISPYVFCGNNPVRYIDPTGEFPIETIWDIGNVLYDVGAAVVNHIKGDHKTARSHWGNAAFDAGAMLIPYVPAGTSKVVKAGASGAKALDRATDARKATRMTENAAKGKAFEKQVGPFHRSAGPLVP